MDDGQKSLKATRLYSMVNADDQGKEEMKL